MTLEMTASGERGVILSRDFDASPLLLFKAHVKPRYIREWMLGPDGWRMTECETDPQPGGGFLFRYESEVGAPGFTIRGTYVSLDAPHRLRHREIMEMAEGSTETHVETRFEDMEGGGTRMRIALGYATTALRDAVMTPQMQAGMAQSYDRLEAFLTARAGKASA